MAQRAVRGALHHQTERHAHADSRGGGDQQHQHHRQAGAQRAHHRQRHQRTHHHNVAVRKVNQAENAVDHGVAQRHQRIDAAEQQAV